MWHVVVVLALLLWVPLVSAFVTALTLRWRLPASAWQWAAVAATFGASTFSLIALLLREPSAVLGGWSPVSAFGAPFALRLTPPVGLLLLSWFVVHLDSALRTSDWNGAPLWRLALMSGALGVLAAAGNMLVLLAGIVLGDLVWMWLRSGDDTPRAHVELAVGLALRTVSTTLLVLAFAGHYATHRSVELGLFPLASDLAPVGAVALGLRLMLAPFVRFATARFDLSWQFGLFTALVLQHRLAEAGWNALPAWFGVWAALSVGQSFTLVLGGRARAEHVLPLAAAALSAALGARVESTAQAASAAAWLVGTQLAMHAPLQRGTLLGSMRRLIGAGALLGLLLSPLWRINGGHAALGVTALGVAALLTRLTGSAFRAWRGARLAPPQTLRVPWTLRWSGMLLLLGALVGAGVTMHASAVSGASLNPAGVAWTFAALSLALGGGWAQNQLRRSAPGVVRFARALSKRVIAAVDWIVATLQGALHRLGTFPARTFDVLERDGALAWLIVVVLLVVLISRAPTP